MRSNSRNILRVLLLGGSLLALPACDSDDVDDATDEVEDVIDDAADDIEDAADDAADTVDDAIDDGKDSVDDAVDGTPDAPSGVRSEGAPPPSGG